MTPDETYWQYCAQAELRLQHCGACGAWQFPPTGHCNTCLSTKLTWEPVSGGGALWSWVRIHKKYFADPRFAPPYLVAMVRLDEGVRMVSAVRDSQGAPLGTAVPHCDQRVQLTFDHAETIDPEQPRLPVFRLLGESNQEVAR